MRKDWVGDDETVIDEEALIPHFKAGTMSGAEERFLARRLTKYVRKNYSALFGEADLIASQAIFQAFRRIEGLQDLSSFYGWIIVITARIAVRRCKELERLPAVSRDGAPVQTNVESPEEAQALWEQTGFDDETWLREMALKEALLSLSDEQQEIIRLHYFEQQQLNTIAEKIGRPHDTVRQIARRACKKMRDYLIANHYADLFISQTELRKLQPKPKGGAKTTALT